jgi:uncharacterized protein (DUF305 family)
VKGAFALAGAIALAGCGGAADRSADGNATSTPATTATAPAQNDAQRAYAGANGRMSGAMATIDADPDVAFAQGMIPHHQGAIDMAKVELRYGKDPEMRALAERVVAAQGPEIAQMQAWLKARGKGAPAAATEQGAHAGH